MRYARGWHERIMAARSYVKWESFYTGYFIYVRCTICLIDARSLNLKACPIGFRHVYFVMNWYRHGLHVKVTSWP